MALEEDIQALLVVGTSVAVTVRFNPGADYSGVVEEVKDGEFELQGEIINQYEHFSNISADPIFRKHRFAIADIASIRKA